MAVVQIQDRLAELRGPGKVLISTDLHGHLRDYRTVVARFDALWAESTPDTRPVLVITGDLFHGPNLAPDEWPDHLGSYYHDASHQLLDELLELRGKRPGNLLILLGNHDHAHIGGPVTAKFHPDEAAWLETWLGPQRADALRKLIRSWPLVARTAGNVVLTHAAAPISPLTAQVVRGLVVDGYSSYVPVVFMRNFTLGQVLWRRAATERETLATISGLTGKPRGVHIHGHVVSPAGVATPNPHELCLSTSFGLQDRNKCQIVIDNEADYGDVRAVQDARCIEYLYAGLRGAPPRR